VEATERPSRLLRALEARAGLEAALLLPALPLLALAPRGDGHSVLVLPGLGADDRSTQVLRWFLRDRGYDACGWKLGTNGGPTPTILGGLRRRFAEVYERQGRKVSLIGWSLGGIYARGLTRRSVPQVRGVITLASAYNAAAVGDEVRNLLPVPTTSIYSRSDGIVPWRACVEDPGPQRENVAVPSSHVGMGHHPATLLVIADRLAQPEGRWRPYSPFVRPG
jgi:hypothetical protein